MSILESMSYGIPNLTSNVGGIPQVVRDGENGMMVDPGNINEMFEKIVFFLENDKLRKSYSENAYQMIQEHFSIEAYFIKWNQLYKELLKVN